MTKSLWGSLNNLPVLNTPVKILREQAEHLTRATKGLLMGAVDNLSQGDRFRYDLDVVAPSLNDYRYTILRISHEIDLYPVIVTVPATTTNYQCTTEEEFISALKDVLTSDKVRKVIASLVAQTGK